MRSGGGGWCVGCGEGGGGEGGGLRMAVSWWWVLGCEGENGMDVEVSWENACGMR